MARSSIFRPNPGIEVEYKDFSAGLIDSVADTNVPPNAITGGQNIEINLGGKPTKRGGISLFGNFLGTTTGILGGWNFVNRAGTQLHLAAYDTQLYQLASTGHTAISGITFTTNKQADGAYFPLTDKFYIVNQTDNVAKIASAASVDQSDGSFKKGKYIIQFQNRLLVANVSGQEDYVWYTDLGVDTFSSNNYFRVVGTINGIIEYYDKALIFTKRKIHRLQNFTFSGTLAGPEAVIPLPVDFGSIYERTIAIVNGYVYFLGQDSRKKVEIYKCDGYKALPIGDPKIRNLLNSLSTAQLASACAVSDGVHYRLHVADSGQTTNTTAIVYRTTPLVINNLAYEQTGGIFYTKEQRFITGRADFSCLWTSENAGLFEVYGGTQNTGQIYKLNQSGSYDELAEERYLTLGTYNVPINANAAKRAAQSFKMSQYTTSNTINITQVSLYMKKNAGTTTNLTVRIETDNNGQPSGTLAASGASATLTAFSTTSYSWQQVAFASAIALTGNTTYWIVVQHVTEGSGTSQYFWLGDTCTPTYAYGNLATWAGAAGSGSNTFNPDANPTSTSVDGYIEASVPADGSTATFAEVRSGTGSTVLRADSTASTAFANITADSGTNNWSSMDKAVVLFDTSTLPDDAIITSATLSIYPVLSQSDSGQFIGITSATPASNTTLATGDYATGSFGSTRLASDIAITSFSLNAYNDFTLNSSGRSNISTTAISKFAVRVSADIDNAAPTWTSFAQNFIKFQTAENTNKPKLVVNYTTAGGTSTWSADAITDQAFMVYAQSPIDAYFDSPAYLPTGLGSGNYKLQRFFTMFSTAANYNVQVGFNNGDFNTFLNFLISLATKSAANTWGGGGLWGSGLIWGGTAARTLSWKSVSGFMGNILKFRVRNSFANQQFVFDGIHISITPKTRQK